MKQLLLISILLILSVSNLFAKEKSQEEITWNIIVERFFNGDYSKVIRFEEDIEFKLTKDATPEDSAIIQEIIVELNDLIETVDVRFAENYGNFTISLLTLNHQLNNTPNLRYNGNKINSAHLNFISERFSDVKERKRVYYYYIIKNLIKTHDPGISFTKYKGIFSPNTFPQFTKLTDLDRDIIRKIYSKDFESNFKEYIFKTRGYLFYQNLIHRGWLKIIFPLIAIVLTILGFLLLLSKEKNQTSIPNIWIYLKKGAITLIGIGVIYWLYQLAYQIPFFEFMNIYYSLLTQIVEVFFYGIFTLIIIYYSERQFLNKFSNFFQKQIFVFSTTILAILSSLLIVSLPFIFINSRYNSSPINYFSSLNFRMLFNTIIIAGLRVFYNFINYRLQGIVNQKDVELAKMKELKNQAELNALHSRINPHFLYNSLNSIAVLAHINPEKTENMAIGLSELFRYSINKENKTFVTVDEELEMVKKYLEIEENRFEDKLIYQIVVDEKTKETLIPKFLIQPLAENAIKHGLSKIKEIGKITIEVKQLEKELIITIFDNGPDFPEEPVSGYGLQNLNDKLQIIYGDKAFINWENGENKHFRITIKDKF